MRKLLFLVGAVVCLWLLLPSLSLAEPISALAIGAGAVAAGSGGAGVGAGLAGMIGLGAGGLLNFLGKMFGLGGKDKDPTMMYNQYGVQAFQEIISALGKAQGNWKEALQSKPWLIDEAEQKRAEKGMKRVQELIQKGDMDAAGKEIDKLPYFGQLYKDQLVYKSPVFSPLLQNLAVRDMLGMDWPQEARQWQDVTGSSRRQLGARREESMQEAGRLAAMAGRSGISEGERQSIDVIHDNLLGELEKEIRTEKTNFLFQKMARGIQMGQLERGFGRESVQLGHKYKADAQGLINQILGMLPGAAQSTVSGGGAYTPPSSRTGQAVGAGLTSLGGTMEDIVGFGLYNQELQADQAYKTKLLDSSSGAGISGGSNPLIESYARRYGAFGGGS